MSRHRGFRAELESGDLYLTMDDVAVDDSAQSRKVGAMRQAQCQECGAMANGFRDQYSSFYCLNCWSYYEPAASSAPSAASSSSAAASKPKKRPKKKRKKKQPTVTDAAPAPTAASSSSSSSTSKSDRSSGISATPSRSSGIAETAKPSTSSEEKTTEPSSSVSGKSGVIETTEGGVKMHGMKLESAKDRRRHQQRKDEMLRELFEGSGERSGSKKKKVKTRGGSGERTDHINLVVVGHVDHGKSTLMGHLLYALGHVNGRDMHRLRKDAQNIGKGSFAYAWVLDQHSEERSRGVTVDVSVNYFSTPHRSVTLLDSPGHRDFIPNMIAGAAQADACILVVSAVPNEFDSGFNRNGQTKEHAILVKSLGVSQVIVAVNKMDLVKFDRSAFDAVCTQVASFLKEVGFAKSKVFFVPVSGLEGLNLLERQASDDEVSAEMSSQFEWYDGPCLVELIDQLKPPASLYEKCKDRPLRVCITDVFKEITLGGTVITGKVVSGCLALREQVLIQPCGLLTRVKGLTKVDGSSEEIAIVGSNIQMNCPVKEEEDLANIRAGDVVCSPFDRPLKPCLKFSVKIAALPLLKLPICKGHELIVHVQSVNAPCKVFKLNHLIDKTSGAKLTLKSAKSGKRLALRHVKAGQTAVITLQASHSHLFCLDCFDQVKSLGRVTLRREGVTVAVGQVTKLYT